MRILSIEEIETKRLRGEATTVAAALKTERWRVMAALVDPSDENHSRVIDCFSRIINARESMVKSKIGLLETVMQDIDTYMSEIKKYPEAGQTAAGKMLHEVKTKLMPAIEAIGDNMKGSYLVGKIKEAGNE